MLVDQNWTPREIEAAHLLTQACSGYDSTGYSFSKKTLTIFNGNLDLVTELEVIGVTATKTNDGVDVTGIQNLRRLAEFVPSFAGRTAIVTTRDGRGY